MKKFLSVLTIIMFAFVAGTFAQKKTSVKKDVNTVNVAAGVFVSQDVAIENLEVGKTFGKNTISLIGQTYKYNSASDRVWSTGVKYYRTVYQSGPFSFQANGSVLMNLTGKYNFLTFKPGVSANVNLTKNIALQAGVSTPIYENSTLFKPTNLESGLQLVFTL